MSNVRKKTKTGANKYLNVKKLLDYMRSHIFSLSLSLTPFSPGSLGRQRPTEEKVKAVVAKQNWSTNVPSARDVLQMWLSPLKAAIEDDKEILKSVVEQRWKGLDLKDFGDPKGKGEEKQKGKVQTFLHRRCHGSKVTAVYMFVFLFRCVQA